MIIVHAIWGMPQTSGVSAFCAEVAAEQARIGNEVIILNDHDNRCPVAPWVKRVTAPSMAAIDVLPDVVHVHAVWSMFSVRVMRWCRQHKVPYVVSPHGGLMPRVFTIGRLKKYCFWFFVLKRLMLGAKAVHCTSEDEVAACKRLGVAGRCFIAPLGVRLPIGWKAVAPLVPVPYVLFVGRLSEEKGLVCLLDAWMRLKLVDDKKIKSVKLVLAGPDWRGHQELLERKIEKEKIPGVIFFGAVDGEVKDALYRHAICFVLPSPMENFSAVVLDALSYGVPVIATQGTPWKLLAAHQLGWWIPYAAESFELALRQAISMSDQDRLELGEKARSLVVSKFNWSGVAEKVLASYG